MSKRVYVTGLGIISAIGNNVPDALSSIKSGRSGIGKINHLKTNHRDEFFVGEVSHSNEDLLKMTGASDKGNYTRTALLGMIAAREAMAHAGIHDVKEMRTGLISATSVGGMDKGEQFYAE